MNSQNEHNDDLEPEVSEGAEIETVRYPDEEDVEKGEPERDLTNQSDLVQEPEAGTGAEENESESSESEPTDTI